MSGSHRVACGDRPDAGGAPGETCGRHRGSRSSRSQLSGSFRPDERTKDVAELCDFLLRERVENPCLLELIWSYWLETGQLVDTITAVGVRFQNKRGGGDFDPLAEFEVTPLRPL